MKEVLIANSFHIMFTVYSKSDVFAVLDERLRINNTWNCTEHTTNNCSNTQGKQNTWLVYVHLLLLEEVLDYFVAAHQAKEIYHARCLEYERLRRDANASPKDVEKAETKFKKASKNFILNLLKLSLWKLNNIIL